MSMRRASTPVVGVPMSILVTAPAMSLIFMPDSPALWKNWVMTLGTFIMRILTRRAPSTSANCTARSVMALRPSAWPTRSTATPVVMGCSCRGDAYYYASVGVPLEDSYSAGVTLGYYDFADDGKASVGEASYSHVAANVTKDAGNFGSFSVNVEYADIESTDALGSVNSDDPKFWLGWSRSF